LRLSHAVLLLHQHLLGVLLLLPQHAWVLRHSHRAVRSKWSWWPARRRKSHERSALRRVQSGRATELRLTCEERRNVIDREHIEQDPTIGSPGMGMGMGMGIGAGIG
jgi:hypothetical protein